MFSEHLDVFDVNTAFQGILSIFLLWRVRKITLIDLSFYYLIEWFHYVLVLWESGLFLNLGLSFWVLMTFLFAGIRLLLFQFWLINILWRISFQFLGWFGLLYFVICLRCLIIVLSLVFIEILESCFEVLVSVFILARIVFLTFRVASGYYVITLIIRFTCLNFGGIRFLTN